MAGMCRESDAWLVDPRRRASPLALDAARCCQLMHLAAEKLRRSDYPTAFGMATRPRLLSVLRARARWPACCAAAQREVPAKPLLRSAPRALQLAWERLESVDLNFGRTAQEHRHLRCMAMVRAFVACGTDVQHRQSLHPTSQHAPTKAGKRSKNLSHALILAGTAPELRSQGLLQVHSVAMSALQPQLLQRGQEGPSPTHLAKRSASHAQ